MYVQKAAIAFFIHTFTPRQGEPLRFSPLHPLSLVATTKPKVFIMPRRQKEKIKKENRDCWIPKTRVTQTELSLVKEKAAAAGLSLSEYERQALIDSVIVKPQNILDVKAILKLSDIGNSLKLLSPISNNLNQLVRKTHIHDEVDIEKMNMILGALEEIKFREIRLNIEEIIEGFIDGS